MSRTNHPKIRKLRYYYNGKRCSKGEYTLAKLLEKHNVKFVQEYGYSGLYGTGGGLLRFDFYLPDYDLLIEYQGLHHYRPVNKYRRAKKVHEQAKIHDELKWDFACSHGIKLLRISYKEYDKLEEILLTIVLNKPDLLEQCSQEDLVEA